MSDRRPLGRRQAQCRTSGTRRLNSSKHPQLPLAARPLKMSPMVRKSIWAVVRWLRACCVGAWMGVLTGVLAGFAELEPKGQAWNSG